MKKERLIKSLIKGKTGLWYTATIKGYSNTDELIMGQITREGGTVYLLHNNSALDGNYPNNMLGYKYSWCVNSGSIIDMELQSVINLKVYDSKPTIKKKRKPSFKNVTTFINGVDVSFHKDEVEIGWLTIHYQTLQKIYDKATELNRITNGNI